jgi:polar amino acid transport system substrate-binding protein
MRKLLEMMVVSALVVSMLTGCGSSKEAAAESKTTDTSTTETATQVLSVGTNAEFPPFEYVDDAGNTDGFDVALIKAIGEKLGMEVEIQNMEFASLITSIGSKTDVAIAGMTITEERAKSVNFSDAYYEAEQYVITLTDSDIASADDLVGKNIGVQLGTTGDFIAEEIKDVKISEYNKAIDAVNDLINGRVDCVIIDKNPALVFADKFTGQITAKEGTGFDFAIESYGIAVNKDNEKLLEQINGALKELKEDGTYDELVKKYIEEN